MRLSPVLSQPGKYELIILDPLYQLFPPGMDENNNAHMAEVYRVINSYAERSGAAIVTVHHFPKGNQSGKQIVDLGSGAGTQSRAVDSHIVMRAHEDDGAIVLEGAVRSFAAFSPACFRLDYPLWKPAPELDPKQLRRDRRRGKTEKPERTEKPADDWTVEKFVATFIGADPQDKKDIVARARKDGVSQRRTDVFLKTAAMQGLAFRWEPEHKALPLRYSTSAQPSKIT